MFLPPEIWSEIVNHTVPKDILEFGVKPVYNLPSGVYFTIICNGYKLRFIYFGKGKDAKPTLQKLLENIDRSIPFKYEGVVTLNTYSGDRSISIYIDSVENKCTVELYDGSSTFEQIIKFKENKKMIVKFLADFENAL